MQVPWYRQFWPWFLIAVPGVSVVAGIAALVAAVRGADSLVRDDWYKSGVTINRDLGRSREAARRHLQAVLQMDPDGHTARVDLQGDDLQATTVLVLELAHPTRAERDLAMGFVRGESGQFSATLPATATGHWHAVLTAPASDWRLTGTIVFPSALPQRFTALP